MRFIGRESAGTQDINLEKNNLYSRLKTSVRLIR